VFGAVVQNFRRRTGGEVLALLGPAEEGEERIWGQIADRVERPPSIEALAATVAGANCYLGNDAGPTHLCAAMGIPTVAMFLSSSPERFGPRGRSVRIIDGRAAMGDVESAVWEAVAERLP
jgi:ADP-heptose:LPS heptosyltransferase